MNLKLYQHTIKQDNDVTFLMLGFDSYLTFKNQIRYLKKQCYARLNIIKVLTQSMKNWWQPTRSNLQNNG